MSKFILSASRCKFEDGGPGFGRTFSYMLFQDYIGKKKVEANSGPELEKAMEDYSEQIAGLTSGSYFITEFLMNGERAFNGYKKRKWELKVDRDPRAFH